LRYENANECQLDSLAFNARQHLRPYSHRTEVNFFEFLVLFLSDFSKDFGEVNQNCREMLAFQPSLLAGSGLVAKITTV